MLLTSGNCSTFRLDITTGKVGRLPRTSTFVQPCFPTGPSTDQLLKSVEPQLSKNRALQDSAWLTGFRRLRR